MIPVFHPGDEYTPGVAAAFAALLAAIAENSLSGQESGVVVVAGDDDALRALLSLDTELPIQVEVKR